VAAKPCKLLLLLLLLLLSLSLLLLLALAAATAASLPGEVLIEGATCCSLALCRP
jgi:hypothetical protein